MTTRDPNYESADVNFFQVSTCCGVSESTSETLHPIATSYLENRGRGLRVLLLG